MKERILVSASGIKKGKTEIAIAWGTHISALLAGFFAARGAVSEELLPFGLGFLGGASATYTPSVAIGVFLGYFFPAIGGGGFRYIAAMLSILAIKLLLGGFKKLTESPLFLAAVSMAASVLTSAVVLGGVSLSFFSAASEAVLAAGGAFFVCKFFKSIPQATSGLAADELVALFITASMLLTGLNTVTFNGISLGHILAITLILAASKYGGTLSGAVSSIAAALSLTLSGTSGEIAVIYTFMGLMAGVFSSFGKYIQVAVPFVFAFIGSVGTGKPILIAQTVIEASFGSALFLMLPRRLGIHLSKFFSVYPNLVTPNSFKKSLKMRLQVAANALTDVAETVEQVSTELSKINSPDFGSVISAIEQDACFGCKLRLHCWEGRRDSTVEAILSMVKGIKEGEGSLETSVPEEFKGRCLRLSAFANSSYKRYADYTSHIAAENRIDEVRSVVSDQFEGISSMLSELSDDLDNDGRFDNSIAEKSVAALKNLNIHAEESSCKIDKYGRMVIELKIKKEPELVINKLQVMKLLSVVCERDFGVPTVTDTGNDIYMSLGEHASIRVDVGVEQKCASDSGICGDAYKYFFDGRGHFVMILSDGMGTGGRAAVDGAMASGLMCRLIKAGFGFDCSLRMLNSSMLFKSTDESLATVDVASIDLFTGEVELFKAGAAPTLIRRSGRVGKAESSSLPAGILREISFDKALVKCKIGDVVVLLSDGAVSDGVDWIKEEIAEFREGTADELAERICESAKRRRTDGHTDDITVITAILKKAV